MLNRWGSRRSGGGWCHGDLSDAKINGRHRRNDRYGMCGDGNKLRTYVNNFAQSGIIYLELTTVGYDTRSMMDKREGGSIKESRGASIKERERHHGW